MLPVNIDFENMNIRIKYIICILTIEYKFSNPTVIIYYKKYFESIYLLTKVRLYVALDKIVLTDFFLLEIIFKAMDIKVIFLLFFSNYSYI